MVILKNLDEIKKIRQSCRLVALVLALLRKRVQPGVTTLELDSYAEFAARDFGAKPAFKGYKGFPYSICASINDEIIHGMPSNRPLKNGDIISVDFGILLNGYYGDAAITIPVGEISNEALQLSYVGEECLYLAIDKAREGARLNQISHAIQSHAELNGYHVVREFVGHGIGRNLHEPPQILNYTNHPNEGIELKKGMVLAIEPMILENNYNKLKKSQDGWTHRTPDGSLAVHWEHTIVVTDSKPEILTKQKGKFL